MRNFQEQVKRAFCYQTLFWTFTVWISCSSDLKIWALCWWNLANQILIYNRQVLICFVVATVTWKIKKIYFFFFGENPVNSFEFEISTGKIKKINLKLWFNKKFRVFAKKNPVNWFEFPILKNWIENQLNFWYNMKNQEFMFQFTFLTRKIE